MALINAIMLMTFFKPIPETNAERLNRIVKGNDTAPLELSVHKIIAWCVLIAWFKLYGAG